MRNRRRAVRLLLVFCSPLSAVVGAENGPPTTAQGEEIVVTGSYIKRTTVDSPSPLAVVNRSDMEAIGAIEIADVVNRMTYNSGSTNVTNAFNGADSSTGETNINLRNLGLGSTLVLLNGRRNVAGGTDAGGNAYVSTSTLIPTIAIERLEIVKDGASALYGSDAIAGVVNFITRDDFEGIELFVQSGTDQETDEQDDLTLAGIAGVSNDRGSMMVSAEYIDRKPLTIDDRWDDYGMSGVSTLASPGTTTASGASSTPYLLGGGAATGLGGAIAGDIDCELAASKHRQSFRAPNLRSPQFAGALERVGACIYDFAPFFSLVGEETRLLTAATARYRLSDNIEAYGEFGYSDQEFFRNNSLFPLVRFPTIPITNPGAINDFERRSLALTGGANPAAITPTDLTYFGRVLGFTPDTEPTLRPVDTDTRETTDQNRIVLGLRGDLTDTWSWDVALTYNERDSTARNTDTRQQQLELAVRGFGGPNCDFASNPAALPGTGNDTIAANGNCYYWNPFFSAFYKPDGALQNAASTVTSDGRPMTLTNPRELYDWMVGEIRTVAETRLIVADALLTGEIDVGLPIGVALGLQTRRDELEFEADDDSNANNFSFILGAADFSADEDAVAAFIELAVPITDKLEMQIAGRVEDFRESNETTYDPKVTLLYRPTDALALRASIGESFRTGSLLQREGQSTQLINIADPFSGAGLAFRPQIGLGNPDLTPEDATAWNVGLSWAPSEGALEGLSVDLDYYDYDYKDLITLEGPADLVARDQASRCPQGLNSNPADAIPDCGIQVNGTILSIGPGIPDQVIRDGTLNFLRVQPTYSNAQQLEVNGLDLTVAYRWPWGKWGEFRTALQGSWNRTWDLTTAQGSVIDGVGSRNFGTTIGRSLPEYKTNLVLDWVMNRHSVNVLVRYVDAYDDNQPVFDQNTADTNTSAVCLGSGLRAFSTETYRYCADSASGIDREIPAWTTVDAQYTFELPAFIFREVGSRISIGGTNVFNKRPPRVNVDGSFDPFVADPRGAVWYVRFTMNL